MFFNQGPIDHARVSKEVEELVRETLNLEFPSETLQKQLKVSDQQIELLYTEGYRDYEENRVEKAGEIFNLLVMLNPFTAKHWLALGATDMTLGKWEEALKRFAVATLLEPEDPYPHFHAYLSYTALGDEVEAEKALIAAHEQAIKQDHFAPLRQEIETLRSQRCRI